MNASMATLDRKMLDKVVEEIARKDNIEDPVVDYKYGSKNGDGYLGVINAIELKGRNKSLSLILKAAPSSSKVRSSGPIYESFYTEVLFYDKVMPAYKDFQERYGLKSPFNDVPRCLATNSKEGEELVVLENIKVQGYDLWDRKKGMNNELIEFVFEEYGKFHAVSFAMKKKEPKMLEELIKDVPPVMNLFLERNIMGDLLANQHRVLRDMLDPVSDKVGLEKLEVVLERVPEIVKELSVPDEFSAIIHGDCWCNNMMFKYNDDNNLRPESMRLIDFQLWAYASPVLDLSYFFYVCASPELLDNIEHYLKIYHKSLSQRLEEFGCDPEDVLPYSELYKKWVEKARFGLFLSVFLFKLMLTDKDDAVNLTEAAENKDNPMNAFGYDIKDNTAYKARAIPVLNHFCKFGFL